MSTSFESESYKSPEVLEQEIDATRRSIGNIVDSLESRFTPGQLIDQALSYTKGHGGEFFQNLGTTLKNNPVPTALTGLGLAWLAMNQNKAFNPGSPSSGPGLGEKIGGAFQQVTGALAQAGDSLHNATDAAIAKGQSALNKASEFKHRTADSLESSSAGLSDTVHSVGDQLSAQTSQLKGQFSQALKEQPLVLAAIGIALGAAVGAALPASNQENTLFGKASDEAVSKVKEKGAEAYAVVKEKVTSATGTVEASPESRPAKTPESAPAGTDLSAGLGIQS